MEFHIVFALNLNGALFCFLEQSALDTAYIVILSLGKLWFFIMTTQLLRNYDSNFPCIIT